MPRRQRRRGAKGLFSDETFERVLSEIRSGAPSQMAACARAGISYNTWSLWKKRGYAELERRETGEEPNEYEDRFVDLISKIEAAKQEGGLSAVKGIVEAAQGGFVTEKRTRRFRNHDGEMVTEVEEKRQPPEWKAWAWMLERQFPEMFGRQATQVQLTGAGGGPVQVSGDASGVASRILATLAQQEELMGKSARALPPTDDSGVEIVDAEIVQEDVS